MLVTCGRGDHDAIHDRPMTPHILTLVTRPHLANAILVMPHLRTTANLSAMTKLPWLHTLADKINRVPASRQTFDKAAKQVRNRLRRYRADSIAQRAMERLHQGNQQSRIDELRSWPWLSLLLVKLVLEDPTIAIDRGEDCPHAVFAYCLQVLWDAQGSRERMDDGPGKVYRMVRSVIQAQMPFQIRPTVDFLRWPALVARLPASHPCRELFRSCFAVEPDEFMQITYMAHVPVLNDELLIDPDYFAPVRACMGADVDQVLNFFSKSLEQLRCELQERRQHQIANGQLTRPHHEVNEPPWLMRYPLLSIGGGRLRVWHPSVFTRGMEQAVHRRLSEYGGVYSSEFGLVFEQYVLELLDDAGITYLSEDAYKQVVGRDKNAVEAIVSRDGVNVFVEAKLTVYSEDLVQHTHGPKVWQALRQVRRAMDKAWKVSERLRQPGLPDWDCKNAAEDILIIVTSQPPFCATGEHLKRLFKDDVFDPTMLALRKQQTPTAGQLKSLPLASIILTSIGEWEHLMGCVKRGEIDLVPFLRDVARENLDPVSSVMVIDQHIEKFTTKWALPALLKTAKDAIELKTVGMLGGSEADLVD